MQFSQVVEGTTSTAFDFGDGALVVFVLAENFFLLRTRKLLHSKQLESCIAEKILERQQRKIRRLTSRGSPVSGEQ